MYVMEIGQASGIADLLRPYTAIAIAEATGRSRQVAHGWRSGSGLPDVEALPKLADFLHVDLADLTRLVADETAVRRAS